MATDMAIQEAGRLEQHVDETMVVLRGLRAAICAPDQPLCAEALHWHTGSLRRSTASDRPTATVRR